MKRIAPLPKPSAEDADICALLKSRRHEDIERAVRLLTKRQRRRAKVCRPKVIVLRMILGGLVLFWSFAILAIIR